MKSGRPQHTREHREVRARGGRPGARRALAYVALAALVCGVVACQRSERRRETEERELVVFAAASLRPAFTVLAAELERSQGPLNLTFNFAGTQDLRLQLEHGATADVFASADQHHMDELVRAGLVRAPIRFAANELTIVVAREHAGALRNFADLPGARRIVIGTPEVPIGRYTLQVLDRATAMFGSDFRARVESRVVSRELNVGQVLTKVRLGEAEAAVVYATDARAASDAVAVVPIPSEVNVIADYPMAILRAAPHPRLAQAWLDLVQSPVGQRALRAAGFLSPRAQ